MTKRSEQGMEARNECLLLRARGRKVDRSLFPQANDGLLRDSCYSIRLLLDRISVFCHKFNGANKYE